MVENKTLNVSNLLSLTLGWFFIFWLASAGLALVLGAGTMILHGLISALFAFWDFILYVGLTSAAIGLGIGVILAKNPINSLFCLIGVFLNAILILLSIRVEFLSMIFLIVYIGAIAILFLFVIMLLNLRNLNYPVLQWNLTNQILAMVFTGLTAKGYFSLLTAVHVTGYYNLKMFSDFSSPSLEAMDQIQYYMKFGLNDVLLFSELLYTQHLLLLLFSGMILLSAMIGSIVLAMSTIEGPDLSLV